MQFEQITIIGVGLIGGSVGLASKARGVARRIVGIDRDPVALRRALDCGAIDDGAASLRAGVHAANFIVVCAPVDAIAQVIAAAAMSCPPTALFTDVGSVKGGLYEASRGALSATMDFVPAHPLAGAEKNGVEYARADLFAHRITIITPSVTHDDRAVESVETFWTALGSRVVKMAADHHDRVLAATSHMPHAVASAVAGVTQPDWLTLSAGGFRDVTRIAAGDPILWAAIFDANKACVLSALSAFTNRLDEFRALLETGDRAGLERWLTEGKQVRDALGT